PKSRGSFLSETVYKDQLNRNEDESMEFRFCKFEDKNLIIIQHKETTIGSVKLDELKRFINNTDEDVKFLNDKMN
ncbi:MAG: hypothetical protein ACLS8D_19530, partial [Clostridioides difficile]